jgi:hypothetical protein
VVSFTPLPLYLRGKSPWIGGCGEERNLALPGIEPGPSSPSLCHEKWKAHEIMNFLVILFF